MSPESTDKDIILQESAPLTPGPLGNLNAGGQLFLAFGLTLVCMVVASLAGVLLAAGIYHLPILSNPEILSDLEAPNVLPALKVIQAVSAIGTFILPALVFASLRTGQPFAFLQVNTLPKLIWVPLTMLLIVVCSPLINLMAEVNSHMHLPAALSGIEHWMRASEDQASKLTEGFLKGDGLMSLTLNLIIVALLAAVGEELLFRGTFQTILLGLTKNVHVAVWATAILFSAFHMQFFGFLPRMMIGALLGYLYVWSGSLWVPILAHFTNNALGVIITYLIQHNHADKKVEGLGSSKEDLVLILISLVCAVVFVFFAWKLRQKHLAPAPIVAQQ
jgi:membrane protease YdiL (CAAX protease family)